MKKIITFVLIVLIIIGAFWAKDYYNNRYVVEDIFYSQVPVDEVLEDSTVTDASGEEHPGKEYNYIGYNDKGESREVSFTVSGSKENYYQPGTYLKCEVSKDLVVRSGAIKKEDIPKKALDKIESLGVEK